ncbi:virulence-associated E family protein [Gordonibacter sp.]|uniref:virulence-associated E family protein n=1 Tax=Gordonibacter sp. TaxID=1968902 RepID=UPI002FC598E1
MTRSYAIATAPGHASARWKNKTMTWEEFTAWQREVRRTDEAAAEYAAMAKAEQGEVKNGPCYVAGYLKSGARRKGSVKYRSMVVLDADNSDTDLWADFEMLVGARACLYPTHSSTKDALKHRLVVALSRDVTPEEYVPLALKIAETLGFARFDATTYQPERLMYKSSCSNDAAFALLECEGQELDPDEWLALYPDWRDVSCWPLQEQAERKRTAKAPDPRDKRGVIGAFCRTYPISVALSEFLGEVYEESSEGRYTFRGGSAFGGVVCYEDLWAYSNHATDPASGKLCNAFDLCRIHLFGDLDAEEREGAPMTALPSYKAVVAWAMEQEAVSLELAHASAQAAIEDFEAIDEGDESWKAKLAKDPQRGIVLPTAGNLGLIFSKDPGIAGKLRRDVESDAVYVVADRLPWRRLPKGSALWTDGDDASLRIYLECRYGIAHKGKTDDAISHAADANPYDPLGEYLAALPEWDGTPRVDTLLIDYMGAEDDDYTRAVTRKVLVAAVRRALNPGCKFDYMLILEGTQGLGKSTLLSKLAGEWFTDSLTLDDVAHPKVAAEKLQGSWICEVAELDGMAKASIERLKSFLTTATDKYRAAYARRAGHYRRRGIIVGTVNNLDGYLRDATGNRRFWPVRVGRKLDHRALGQAVVDQIWAETKALEAAGEPLYLDAIVERAAEKKQRRAMETDPREGLVSAYLDTPVPADFSAWTTEERDSFWSLRGDFGGAETDGSEGLSKRDAVAVIEIWHECFRQPTTKPTRNDSYQIAAILKKMGWEPTGKTKELKAYGKVKIYGRGENEEPSI